MTTITIPPEVARALPGEAGCFELRSVDGKVLGTYIPALDAVDSDGQFIPEYGPEGPPLLTGEELAEIERGPSYTTKQVLARLKSLE